MLLRVATAFSCLTFSLLVCIRASGQEPRVGCHGAGCSAPTSDFVVVVSLPPAVPGAISAPSETGPAYTVAWSAPGGTVDHYDLDESLNSGSWTTISTSATSKSFSNKDYGTYSYRVRACNSSGCSAYTAPYNVTVITALSDFPDSPVVRPSVPEQQWVGTFPGTASVEGGAAIYRVPIEVPPGRVGMQPDISLSYSSRNGNGIAGVGWSVSGLSTIYRCPRTLAQDGGNRTVQHDARDRLCLDGQRLVGPAEPSYGTDGSEYRTEVDQFDRITLTGKMSSWSSYFEVEHKSGRISRFEPGPSLRSPFPPDVWYLVSERDRQSTAAGQPDGASCISYSYTTYASRSADQDRELQSITYTGTMSSGQCVTGADARSVEFSYTSDREDKRTTYRFGVASMMVARLAAISTRGVGSRYVRRYELAYHLSASTRRSLLTSVTLCAGATCGVEKLPSTTFRYQEDSPSFDMWHVQRKDQSQPLGADWRVIFVGDLDGDGIRDSVYAQYTGERDLELSTGCVENGVTGRPFWFGFDAPIDATPLAGQADFDNDGRVDVLGTNAGFLAFAAVTCSGSRVNWNVSNTNWSMPITPSAGLFAEGIDYDGDGIIDLMYADSISTEKIVLHRSQNALDWSPSNILTIAPPSAPDTQYHSLAPKLWRDINGDGLVDTVFDVIPGRNPEPTQLAFFQYAPASEYTYIPLTAVGGPGDSFAQNPWRGWIDVNGDGLPDIYQIGSNGGSIYVNRGGPVGSKLFEQVKVSLAQSVTTPPSLRRLRRAFVMDIDGDGQDELIVPDSRVIWYCGGDSRQHLPSGDPAWFCGDEFDTAPEPWASYDRSVFKWNAYKFIEQSDGSYQMVQIQTNLEAPTNFPSAEVDSNGDGMTDVSYSLVNGINNNGYKGFSTSDLGPYISRNLMRAPDLLLNATNGVGAVAWWTHRPLSDSPDPTIPAKVLDWEKRVGCDLPKGETFYVAHHDDPRSPGYAFFTSSMWAVARLELSNGIGTATNKTCYRYEDAMLNTEGRGFQGFKVIVAEEQMPVAVGEDATGIPNLDGCGGTCSPNNLVTRTDFYQEFPLTSRLNRTTVSNRTSGAPLRQTIYFWHVASGALRSTIVYSSGTVEREYDATRPLAKQTTTVSEIDPGSGEATRTCAVGNGATPDMSLKPQDRISVETRTLVNDAAPVVWWLARVLSSETVSDFLTSPFSLNETCTVTGNGRCSSLPPLCPIFAPSKNAKTETVMYRWNDDSAPQGSRRMLRLKQINARSPNVEPSRLLPPSGVIVVTH